MHDEEAPGPLTQASAPQAPGRLAREGARTIGSVTLPQDYDEVVISTSAVDAYVEKNSKRFIDELKELCSFPSISNHGRDAIQPARDWLATRLAKFTDRVETLEAGEIGRASCREGVVVRARGW